MYRRLNILITLLFALCVTHPATAQTEDVYDYKHYKFYDEEEEEPWWLIAGDTLTLRLSTIDSWRDIFAETNYAMSVVENSRRGESYNEERYMADNIVIDYKTARLLSSMGIRRTSGGGISSSPQSGAITSSTTYTLAEDAAHSYERQYLRGELSGRNYIGGLSYSATYIPTGNRPELKEDWHIRLFTRARTGRDIYVDGCFTNSADIAASISRQRRNSNIGIAILLPYSERGTRQASTEEAFTLTGNSMYNPSWGMQDGVVRNSRVTTTLRPEAIISWNRRLSKASTLVISANGGYDSRNYTALTWFDAMTPAPDNYRYMPSYQDSDDARRIVTDAWVNNDLRYTQIDWASLYHTNAIQSDGEAAYALEGRHNNTLFGTATAGLKGEFAHIILNCGIDISYTTTRSFKVIEDLLGADHILDLDYYLLDDATYSNNLQNDLHNPNRKVTEGERFGYDYRLTRRSAALRGVVEWQHNNNLCLLAGAHIATEQSQRRGYYEKELFAGTGSYGKSRNITLMPYRLHAAVLYTINRHSLRGCAMLRGESPDIDNLFLQPQYNNRTIERPQLRQTIAGEISYTYNGQRLELNATAFITSTTHDTEVVRYYDDLAATYTDAVISDIGRLNFGVELSSKIKYSRLFTSLFAITLAQHSYSCNPKVTLYADTDNDLLATSYAAMGRCYAPYPKITAYGDIGYRSANGWSAKLSMQYWGVRYVEPSFIRRSERVTSYTSSPEELSAISHQKRLPDAFSIDLSVGKRFRFSGGSALYLQLSIRNLIGSEIIARGYEQHRIRQQVIQQRTHIKPFVDRLTYAYPRTAYLSIGFSF